MTGLSFRNVDAAVGDPVETWPVEAIQTALARGNLHHWRRLISAVRRDPWGHVARDIEHVLGYDRPYGVAPLMEHAIANERERARGADRRLVAERLQQAVAQSRLTQSEFATRIGTSASRLSTYLSGSVTPSAALLVRAERVGLATP